MININLLPVELQKAAKTPRMIFFAVIGGVSVVMTLGFGVLWLWMSVRGVERQVESRRIEVRALEEEAREVDRLNEDIALYKDREKAIIEIKSRRIFWGLKLYQLMISTPSEIWITSLDLDMLEQNEHKWEEGKIQDGGTLSMKVYAKGTDVTRLTSYRSRLEGDRRFYESLILDDSVFPDNFFGSFLAYYPIEYSNVFLDGYEDPNCLYHNLKVALEPRFEKPGSDKGKKADPKKKKK